MVGLRRCGQRAPGSTSLRAVFQSWLAPPAHGLVYAGRPPARRVSLIAWSRRASMTPGARGSANHVGLILELAMRAQRPSASDMTMVFRPRRLPAFCAATVSRGESSWTGSSTSRRRSWAALLRVFPPSALKPPTPRRKAISSSGSRTASTSVRVPRTLLIEIRFRTRIRGSPPKW